MVYVITGKRKGDNASIKVFRNTLAEAKIHAAGARKYGGKNVKIRKVKR